MLSSNEYKIPSATKQPNRNPVEDKVTIRKMLAKKSVEGYTVQIKELLHKFGAEKLTDVDPTDYEEISITVRRDWDNEFKSSFSNYQSDELERLLSSQKI